MRNDLKFGLIGGGVSIAWTLLMWVLGLHQGNLSLGMTLGYVALIFPILIVFFAIKKTRDKELEGFISYGKGVGVGTITGLIATVVSTLFSYIYMTVLNPGYTEAMKNFQMDKIMQSPQAKNITQEQLSKQMEMMSSPSMQIFQYIGAFVSGILLYAVISLIIAAILQKKKIEEIKQV